MASPTDSLTDLPASVAELLAKGQLGANETDTERVFGFGGQTMRRWRRLGVGPRYSRPIAGGRIYYVFADVLAWLRASGHESRAAEVAANGIGGGV